MMKCSGVPFTHICEWKRHSPSSGSSGSPGWSLVVAMVALGSASMICIPLSGFVSESESASDSEAFTLATNDCFDWQSAMLCQGLFVNSNLVQYLLQTDIQKRTEKIQWQIQTLHRDFSPGNPNRENQHILY
jgi:hypothetical protein